MNIVLNGDLQLRLLSMKLDTQEYIQNIESIHTIKSVDGRYQVKEIQLGSGSFAHTYLSLDTKKNAILACKMISKKNLIDKINLSKNKSLTKDYFINALKNQVKAWKSLNQCNIVKFWDFSQTQNNIYFFLEYCSGGNLQSKLDKQGSFQQNKALFLMYQLANGCAYLYDQGVYHRDLKTQNILITDTGQIKISDFGFAKIVADKETKNNPSSQTSVGTPIYMSPQVLIGDPYTIKCDVWSLGIVFYRLLYNLYPWQKTDNLFVLIDRMKDQISFPPINKVSNWIKKLIQGMLVVQQNKRLSIKQVQQIIKSNTNFMDIQTTS